jgi:hypothetical protein
MENTKKYLTLKWGTLKTWDFTSSEEAISLLREYGEIGSSFSAMCQRDTDRQKEIICELIDLCDGDTIYLEWESEKVTKEEAKNYVLNYGSDNYQTTKLSPKQAELVRELINLSKPENISLSHRRSATRGMLHLNRTIEISQALGLNQEVQND